MENIVVFYWLFKLAIWDRLTHGKEKSSLNIIDVKFYHCLNRFQNNFLYVLQMNITNLLTCALLSNECLRGIWTILKKILPTIKFLNLVFFKNICFSHFYKATTESSWPPADNITTFASIYWSIAKTGSTHKPFEKIYVLHDSNLSINAHALFFNCDSSIQKTSVKEG